MDPTVVCISDAQCPSGANGWVGWCGSVFLIMISSIHLYAYCKDGEAENDDDDDEDDHISTEPMMGESDTNNNPNYADPSVLHLQN